MAMLIEILFDLLDLYTHKRSATFVGRTHNLNTFISICIILYLEASAKRYPRYKQRINEKAFSDELRHHSTSADSPAKRCPQLETKKSKDGRDLTKLAKDWNNRKQELIYNCQLPLCWKEKM